MYERAAEVGGELLVAASPDGGTVVSASLPLDPAGRAAASPAAASAAGTGPSLPPDTLESVTQR
jgi:signal transduction histidine kinase